MLISFLKPRFPPGGVRNLPLALGKLPAVLAAEVAEVVADVLGEAAHRRLLYLVAPVWTTSVPSNKR